MKRPKKKKNKNPIAFAHNLRHGAGAGVHKDKSAKRLLSIQEEFDDLDEEELNEFDD